MTVIVQNINEHMHMSGINQNMNKEVMAQFLASAIVGVVEWWVTNAMPCPVTEMVEQLWLLLERMQVLPETAKT